MKQYGNQREYTGGTYTAAAHRRRARNKLRGRLRLAVAILTLMGLIITLCLFANRSGEAVLVDATPDALEKTEPLPDLSAEGLEVAFLQQATLYGTAFQVTVDLPASAPEYTAAELVLSMGENRCSWPLTVSEDGSCLQLSALINEGVDIQQLPLGEGVFTLQLTDAAATVRRYRLQPTADAAGQLPITRYTVTQNGQNKLVTFYAGQHSIICNCRTAVLPEDTYDIVLDPGHGATDGGSVWEDIYEKDVVLEIAKLTKLELEARGYKVFLTRDGTEDPETMMAYTAYEPDGRVNTTQSSGAKLCLSLHLNSLDEYVSRRGVQVYAADRMNYGFASLLAQSIADGAGSCCSDMAYYRIADGVFCRTMDQQDLDDLAAYAARKSFAPFDVSVGTNFYFIIRETGGIITGAYMDGRNPDYGTNLYMNSNVGVETYLCELGFLSEAEDRALLTNNKQGYAKGIADAVDARFGQG